ncbi:MAG: peptidylprolyl isomerase [Ignavibacteriae bacterium]|nr:peptidylprolyl isomerase [Ignavibacteriota bacterium]
MKIAKNSVVTIDYTLTDDNGHVIDSSEGQEPLTYLHGAGNIIPGLENTLEGKNTGDAVKVSVPPADGYGEWDEKKITQVSKKQFTGIEKLEVGMEFTVEGDKHDMYVTVTKIEGDKVTVDANYPLAGKTLNFDVTVKNVRAATPDEISHGHIHGPGGHH